MRASLVALVSLAAAQAQLQAPVQPVELDPGSSASFTDQLKALREHADDVVKDGRPENLMHMLTGAASVLQEGQQMAQRLQGSLQAAGQSAPPALASQISVLGGLTQRVKTLQPVATAFTELTKRPDYKPPSPRDIDPGKEQLVEQALVKYLIGGDDKAGAGKAQQPAPALQGGAPPAGALPGLGLGLAALRPPPLDPGGSNQAKPPPALQGLQQLLAQQQQVQRPAAAEAEAAAAEG